MQKKLKPQALPSFRKDIKLTRGPDDADGSPTYALYDPVVGNYYKINWKESLVFRHFQSGMDSQALSSKIEKHSTLRVEPEEIESFFIQLAAVGLLSLHRDSSYYSAMKERKTQSWWMWLLYHYLYIRIPLINPDRFLGRNLKYVEFLGSRPALICYTLVSVVGLYLILQRLDEFLHTFTYFFNLEGVFFYALGITVTKLIHEFSHAFVAKHYKLYVPSMGIALIVLWPVLYTDVTEGWKLSNRKHRLLISFAGVLAEVVIAAFATVGWAFSTPGVFQSVCFVLATTSLISTLMINLNPAVRFDGYYILCDLWGIDNLQNRAFAITRWKYLDWLLGVKMPPPETGLSQRRIFWLVAYTIYTWVYRIFLYTAIALFVYYEFTKALGIILFIAEVGIFMIWPLWWEAREIYRARSFLKPNYRVLGTLLVTSVFFIYVVLPWPHRIAYDSVIVPVKEQIVWVPASGQIEKILAQRGQHVEKGQELAVINSVPLNIEYSIAKTDKNLIQKQILQLGLDEEKLKYLGQIKDQEAIADDKLAKLSAKINKLKLKSEITGTLFEWDNDLKPQENVSEGRILGKIADFSGYAVQLFVPESDIEYFKIGQPVSIRVEHPIQNVEGNVTRIAPFSSEKLLYPALASVNFGPLPVVEQSTGQLFLIESYYIVYAEIDKNAFAEQPKFGQTATVYVRGPWRSYAADFVRKAAQVLIRESSL